MFMVIHPRSVGFFICLVHVFLPAPQPISIKKKFLILKIYWQTENQCHSLLNIIIPAEPSSINTVTRQKTFLLQIFMSLSNFISVKQDENGVYYTKEACFMTKTDLEVCNRYIK